MKSIERKFKKLNNRNPYWSSLICFAETIKSSGLSRQSIHRWFNKLVNKNDYDKTDKKQVMSFLESIGKRSTTTKNQGDLPTGDKKCS
jgi:hypothetical protein